MEEIKEKTVNLCAHIPASLHRRVREEQERSGKTLGEYMTMLINEYYELKEGVRMKEKDTSTKVLAVQIPAELFDALDEYIARHNTGILTRVFSSDRGAVKKEDMALHKLT